MENFNIYLSRNICDSPNFYETDFETTIPTKNVALTDYEVALSSILFDNTIDVDLGSVILTSVIANDDICTFEYKIKTKYGTDFEELFKDIEKEIGKAYAVNEFKRRVLLRDLEVVAETE